MQLSDYAKSLPDPERSRYIIKIAKCGGDDPLALSDDHFTNDVAFYPSVDRADIRDYLVHGTSFVTQDQLKSYKSLEAHNYVTSGLVEPPRVKVRDGNVVVVGKVRHSQAFRDKLLLPWLLIKADGEVLCAHCTCMAGLGEACSHVGAVLFYLEAVVTRRDGQSCTDGQNAWLPPHLVSLECRPVAEMDFASSAMKKRRLDDTEAALRDPPSVEMPKPREDEMLKFFSSLSKSEGRPVLLSLAQKFADPYIPLGLKYPKLLLRNLQRKQCPISLEDVQAECRNVLQDLSIEPDVCVLIEKQTKAQSASEKWHLFRTGRITASNAGAVFATSLTKPSKSLLKRLCYPEDCKFQTAATQWGKKKEAAGRAAYIEAMQKHHLGFKCEMSGLHISIERPFLAATPDGLVHCNCCGDGLLEIKCPYSAKDALICEIPERQRSYLVVDGNDAKLLRNHHYFKQVMMQMFVCKRNYCDFVVWTQKDIFIERVMFDKEFCNEIVDKCALYFERVLLPELCFRYWTTAAEEVVVEQSAGSQDDKYCHCQQPEYGDMIRCDGKHCSGQWFHFQCVNLKRAPKSRKWFCNDCKKS
ncbi:uncharacterized protein [Dermacentor albipictus]|uniref:uncharacterized protein n=1 Tax=Dermacentor albipictus TaxID=60249 RepID=UPI0038FD1C28